MTEPTKEQLDKWKNEYQEWSEDESNPNPFQSDMDYDEYGEACYLAAKKSDFEELQKTREQLEIAEAALNKYATCDDVGSIARRYFKDKQGE